MTTPVCSPWETAKELYDHGQVYDVRASKERITIAFAPEDKNVEKLPVSCYDHIMEVISDTLYKPEEDCGRLAEHHSWSGGVHSNPMIPSSRQPAGYELQYHFVK